MLHDGIYWSDGAASHFKNNYNLLNLRHHKKDFGLAAAWTFSAACHGKGPCDGIGAAVKATVTRAALHGNPEAQFQKAMDFWSFIFHVNERFPTGESGPIESYFLPRARIEEQLKQNLEARWEILTSSSEYLAYRHPLTLTPSVQISSRVFENTINLIHREAGLSIAKQYQHQQDSTVSEAHSPSLLDLLRFFDSDRFSQ